MSTQDNILFHVEILVTGRVQGVGFRAYIRRLASQKGIKGYVRNLPTGNVEIHAEGKRAILLDFIRMMKKEVSMAQNITGLQANWNDKLENYTSFNIRF